MSIPMTENRKLVVITTNGPIMELGGIAGPVVSPCYVNVRTLINMVHSGVSVYEVNPLNYDEQIKLTIQNVNASNFEGSEKTVSNPEATKAVDNKPVEEVLEAEQTGSASSTTNDVEVTKNPLDAAVEEVAKKEEKEESKEKEAKPANDKANKSDFSKKK